MAGSCVWGVDREAIEQWGNMMCVLLVFLCGDCRGAYFFLGNIFSGRWSPLTSIWYLTFVPPHHWPWSDLTSHDQLRWKDCYLGSLWIFVVNVGY